MMYSALILVDIQNDFLPGGSLAVPEGDSIIPYVNSLMNQFEYVVATQDWHPADHGSFASQHQDSKIEVGSVGELDGLPQVFWPDHCVQNTSGAEFSSELDQSKIAYVTQKGTNRLVDSYSGFFDNARRQATDLEAFLRKRSVDSVQIVGLATDYCVKFTALDARDLGFQTAVHVRGIRGVELQPGDCQRALDLMKEKGIAVID